MTCYLTRGAGMTLWEAKENLGFAHGWDAGHKDRVKRRGDSLVRKTDAEIFAEQVAEERRIVLPGPDERMFLCGSDLDLDAEKCAHCGYLGDLLCDYPVGRGKTCDLPLCEICARQIGNDQHLCSIHFAQFVAKPGTTRINPWPPKRGTEGVDER